LATPSSAARWARRRLVEQLRRVPPLHRAAKELLVGAKLLRSQLRQAQRRWRGQAPAPWLQSTLVFEVPLHAGDAEALHAELRAHGLVVLEGRHTLYLPPQPGLLAALGPVAAAFGPGCGIKLLKRFAAPHEARYLHHTDALGEAALLGGIHQQALGAAALATVGLGPRCIDVVHLRAGAASITAIIVEHVDGRRPTVAEHARLLDALDALRSRGRLSLANPSGYACGDFAAPDCNGNLWVVGDGASARLRYVDPQVLMMDVPGVIDDVVARHRDVLHFGDRLGVVHGGERFLYQGLPGRRDVGRRDPDDRFEQLAPLLAAHGASLRDRVVFDVCCNAGLMMAGALRRGARWAVGWDLPPVADAARELLPLLGAGRSTLIGRPLKEVASLVEDVPPHVLTPGQVPNGVCLFLAAWHHVGFPPGVGGLPWRWLVYEGREHEEAEITRANVATMEVRWQCRAVAERVLADGLCGPRPVVLLTRSPG
jgi:hypothetical protein